MNQTKTLKISEVILQLEDFKKDMGDLEVFMLGKNPGEFDGVGRVVGVAGVGGSQKDPVISFFPSGDYLKINPK
jgi:hypothetical protein